MKTITKFIYSTFAVVILAIATVTANGAPGDLYASINGDGSNGGGFIYQYEPDEILQQTAGTHRCGEAGSWRSVLIHVTPRQGKSPVSRPPRSSLQCFSAACGWLSTSQRRKVIHCARGTKDAPHFWNSSEPGVLRYITFS
jgi:hypothetical protein